MIDIVLPSTLTPPNALVVAVGSVYAADELIMPFDTVIVDPSTLTPPRTVVEAVGSE